MFYRKVARLLYDICCVRFPLPPLVSQRTGARLWLAGPPSADRECKIRLFMFLKSASWNKTARKGNNFLKKKSFLKRSGWCFQATRVEREPLEKVHRANVTLFHSPWSRSRRLACARQTCAKPKQAPFWILILYHEVLRLHTSEKTTKSSPIGVLCGEVKCAGGTDDDPLS